MSANAGTWFYSAPETAPYLISERLNGTFWGARIVDVYWKCTHPEPPFRATGYMGDERLELSWLPGQWLSLHVPQGVDSQRFIDAISKRVLAFPATCTYVDTHGRTVIEWHTDQGQERWNEIQGRVEFSKLKRL